MSWIENISLGIEQAFSSARTPLPTLPAVLMLPELYKRPGLSAIALATAIIRRLPEAGIETGVNPDGSPNKIAQFIRIFSEEIVKEIKDNGRVTAVIEPGSVVTTGTGANAGGPITIISTNTIVSRLLGLMQ